MKRIIVLSVLIAIGGVSLGVSAYQAPPVPPDQVLRMEKVRDNLYVLKGVFDPRYPSPRCPENCNRGGGNTGVFITDSGVVLIDTKDPGWGTTILAEVKKLTDKPVTTIINTHTHADHVGNNPFFPASVNIVTHENTKVNMEKLPLFQGAGSTGLPDRTFKDTLTLFSGKDRIDLYYFGRGHTNGDIFVVFPAVRTVHAGDMFAFKSAMVVNPPNGGSAVEFPQTLAKAVAGLKGVDTIITGHGLAVLPWRALDEQQRFNRDIVAFTQDAIKAGKSVDDATTLVNQRLYVSGGYEGYQYQPYRLKEAIQAVYDEVKGPAAKP